MPDDTTPLRGHDRGEGWHLAPRPALLLPTHGTTRLFTFGFAVLGLLLLLAPVVAVTEGGDSVGTRALAWAARRRS